jgi:cyanophycinase-like exopeptidase
MFLGERMLTGDGDANRMDPKAMDVRSGIGLASGLVIDRHFFARRRVGRLLSAMMDPEAPPAAIGVEEDGVALLSNERHLEVLRAPGPAFVIRTTTNPDIFTVKIVRPGKSCDLGARP